MTLTTKNKTNQNGANMKKNDVLELKIHDINNLGMGVAKAPDGRAVFVGGAVDGDIVLAKIIKVCYNLNCMFDHFP